MFHKNPAYHLKAYLVSFYRKFFDVENYNDANYLNINDWARKYPDIIGVGEYTYGSPKIYLTHSVTKLKIGKFCSIARDVVFLLGGNHRGDWITTSPIPWLIKSEKVHNINHSATKGDIYVGNDVWIGLGAMILSGVSIGDGVIIGAGSVVTKSTHTMQNGAIPPYSIIAGNPARIIGYRFSQDIIDTLLQIKWWDWPLDKIVYNIDILCSSDIDRLRQLPD